MGVGVVVGLWAPATGAMTTTVVSDTINRINTRLVCLFTGTSYRKPPWIRKKITARRMVSLYGSYKQQWTVRNLLRRERRRREQSRTTVNDKWRIES